MLDVFTPSAFTLHSLTAAIERTKYVPGRISALGLFEVGRITTLDSAIELRDGVLHLLNVKPRGAPGTPILGSKRKVKSFRVPHIPATAALHADEVQGVRAFGSENQAQVLQAKLNERLGQMRLDMDYTNEAHRVAAIKGTMYDANGTTIDLFAEFGVTQQTVNFALTTATTKVRQKVLEVIEKVESALDGTPYASIRVVCGKDFWAELIEHDAVKETYLNTAMAASLRNDPTIEFEYGGVIWERYRGNSQVSIGNDDAYAVPSGVPNLFLTRYAPADYNETVNTLGRPYYAKAERMKFDKGYELEGQSNPLNICTRPNAIIKLEKA